MKNIDKVETSLYNYLKLNYFINISPTIKCINQYSTTKVLQSKNHKRWLLRGIKQEFKTVNIRDNFYFDCNILNGTINSINNSSSNNNFAIFIRMYCGTFDIRVEYEQRNNIKNFKYIFKYIFKNCNNTYDNSDFITFTSKLELIGNKQLYNIYKKSLNALYFYII